jgi:hypothetical protein
LFSRSLPVIMYTTCRECGADEGQMNELMGRLATDRGDGPAAAEDFVEAILAKLVKDDRAGTCAAVDVLAGIGDAIPTTRCDSGGMLGVVGAEWRRI